MFNSPLAGKFPQNTFSRKRAEKKCIFLTLVALDFCFDEISFELVSFQYFILVYSLSLPSIIFKSSLYLN